MDSFEERIALYKKAGTPKAVILEKIERDFGLEYRQRALEILNSSEQIVDKNKNKKISAYVLMFVLVVFIIISLILFTDPIFKSNELISSKCTGAPKITINGTSDFKVKATAALELVENKSCPYLLFIASNYPVISSQTPVPISNLYSPLKHSIAQNYVGSDYFVADAIIHETCHAYQSKLNAPQNEHDCALTQFNFLSSINAPQEDIDKVLSLKSTADYSFDENNIDVFNLWIAK